MALAIHFHDQLQQPHEASLRDETLAGFAATPKWASPKFFYDRRGSELFEQICRQPEYYITRTEEQILAEAANDILEEVDEEEDDGYEAETGEEDYSEDTLDLDA